MSRRDDVLAALAQAAPDPLSGQRLAERLGISRVAVGKHVAALIDAGYAIDAIAGTGYRLTTRPDLPLDSEVLPRLETSLWTEIAFVPETGSTNDDLKGAARDGAPHGSVLAAGGQSEGRGRLGRTWLSPQGGVYVSMLLRPEMSPAQSAPVPLVVGLGVARALESLGVESVALKWPNDVWIDRSKVAGVLVESSAEADWVEWLVIGVGLNVKRPAESFEGAAYIADHADVGIVDTAAAVLDGVARAWEQLAVEGFAAMRAEYEARSALVGEDLRVLDRAGVEQVRGVWSGVDDTGRMLVRTPDGITPVASGDVTLDMQAR